MLPAQWIDDDCLQELRWIFQSAARPRPMAGQVGDARCPKLCQWVEDNIEETLTFTRLPRQHHKRLKSTNILERLIQEIKRRTHVVRIFPSAERCLRLVRALAVETHENWLEAMRLNMERLAEHKKEMLRKLEQPKAAVT
ncbi:transposase [Aminobacter sp. BA135]